MLRLLQSDESKMPMAMPAKSAMGSDLMGISVSFGRGLRSMWIAQS
jgi:hypothetical protein